MFQAILYDLTFNSGTYSGIYFLHYKFVLEYTLEHTLEYTSKWALNGSKMGQETKYSVKARDVSKYWAFGIYFAPGIFDTVQLLSLIHI